MEQNLKLQLKVDQNQIIAAVIEALASKNFYVIEPKMLNRKEAAEFLNVGVDTFDKLSYHPKFPKKKYGKYSNLAIASWMSDVSNFL